MIGGGRLENYTRGIVKKDGSGAENPYKMTLSELPGLSKVSNGERWGGKKKKRTERYHNSEKANSGTG